MLSNPLPITGLMPVRNEDWVVQASIQWALRWCQKLVVLDHASTDLTSSILMGMKHVRGERLVLLEERNATWNEATIRQRMLVEGRKLGNDYYALIDADEFLAPHAMHQLAETGLQPGELLRMPWRNMWRSLRVYRSDDSRFGSQSMTDVVFRDAPGLSFQPKDGGYQIHTRRPVGAHVVEIGGPGVLHLQHASWRRLCAKQALYKMNEVVLYHKPVDEINARYDPTVSEVGVKTTELPKAWEPYVWEDVNLNAPPWQEAECHRLLLAFGAERFAGLNLYGVCHV